MQFRLAPHPTTMPRDPSFEVWVRVDVSKLSGRDEITLLYGVSAPADRFSIPSSSTANRRDGLWRTTCFEAFIAKRGDEAPYREWNFAPSGDWAAYDFAGYRESMRNAEVRAAPRIRMVDRRKWWTVRTAVDSFDDRVNRIGLSAVLEERGGPVSYWALSHPLPDRADFHHPGSFTKLVP